MIFVVDDDHDINSTLRLVLEGTGFKANSFLIHNLNAQLLKD
jgi:FixJ family two-component response regulator